MGFGSFLRKMVTGRPVFETPPASVTRTAGAPLTPVNPSLYTDAHGQKIIPEVTIDHCKTHLNGDQMEVTAWLTNTSPFELELDAMVVIDQKIRLDRRLRPGDGHEAWVYKGARPATDSARTAQLYYRIVENGDAFCADFMVKYKIESDGKFVMAEFYPGPARVHDI